MSRGIALRRATPLTARGFSVVELMVAMTLSLILMAGALSILYSSKLTYTENERIARLQEAGRTVVELVLRDARVAGYEGCTRPLAPTDFVNNLDDANSVLWNFIQPVFGYNASSSAWTPALDATAIPSATAGSDVIVLRTSPPGAAVFRTNAAVTTAANIPVNRAPNTQVAPGTPMIISDCWGSSVFVATGWANNGATGGTIAHAAGGGAPPTNSSGSLTREFRVGAVVMPVQTIIYYVRDSTSGNGPALWRKLGAAQPQVLIEGVENLQILYGMGTASSPRATRYIRADQVLPNEWNNVVSITMSVLVRSEVESGVEADNRTYSLLGADGATLGPFADRRQRAVYTTTVVLRNRAE